MAILGRRLGFSAEILAFGLMRSNLWEKKY
jgi:hypothetical protein